MYLVSECAVCAIFIFLAGAAIFAVCVLLLLINESAAWSAFIMFRTFRHVVTVIRAQRLALCSKLPSSVIRERYRKLVNVFESACVKSSAT